MARRKKKTRSRGGAPSPMSGASSSEFQCVKIITLSSGTAVVPFNPTNLSSQIQSMGDGFVFFRVRKLKFKVFAFTAAAAVACVSSNNSTPPATIADVMEIPDESVTHEAVLQTQPTPWVNVKRTTFSGQQDWYYTTIGSYSVEDIFPCTFAIAGSGSNVVKVYIKGVLEFKDQVNIASTPEESALLKSLRLKREADARAASRLAEIRKLCGLRYDQPLPDAVRLVFGVPMTVPAPLLKKQDALPSPPVSCPPVDPAACLGY